MARRGPSRSGGAFGIWWFGYAVLGILTATGIVLVALTFTRSRMEADAAAAAAAHYTPPTVQQPPIVSVVGDSYTGGSDMNSSQGTLWPSLVGADLHVAVESFAVGGSGYVTRAAGTTDRTTFVDRAAEVDPASTEVIFFGSRNDNTDPATVRAAAVRAFTVAARRAPHARLVVIGPAWTDSSPPAGILADRDAVHAAAEQAQAVWVDPLTADWFPTGAAGLIGSDGVHPTDAGHKHLRDLIEPVVKALLAP
jgi:lysophospholipase L1-like esterase